MAHGAGALPGTPQKGAVHLRSDHRLPAISRRAPIKVERTNRTTTRRQGTEPTMHKLTADRMKWGVSALLAGSLLSVGGLLCVQPWPYWVAKNGWLTKYTGDEVVLHG